MKTKELIKEIEELNLIVYKPVDGHRFVIQHENLNEDCFGEINDVASFNDIRFGGTSTNFVHFQDLNYETQCRLLILLNMYSLTDVKKRDDEKKFLVKTPKNWANQAGGYFFKMSDHKSISISLSPIRFNSYFTEDEIEHYKLENFEKVEV